MFAMFATAFATKVANLADTFSKFGVSLRNHTWMVTPKCCASLEKVIFKCCQQDLKR